MNYNTPHRRYNPLLNEWVLVSPHRVLRPWQGQVEKPPSENLPRYDPDCYLCPGNARVGGKRNPQYSATFVFDNDFPAVLDPTASDATLFQSSGADGLGAGDGAGEEKLLIAEPVSGICRVVCFSPRHDLTLPQFSQEEVEAVVRTWSEQTRELDGIEFIQYVQIFENKGAIMGCSNPHPHSQIWATSFIPDEPAKELTALSAYRQRYEKCLLCDYLTAERSTGVRKIVENDYFTAVVPYWAVWPFEVLVVSRRHCASLPELDKSQVAGLADILLQVTRRYDALFQTSFPYSMGLHQSPSGEAFHYDYHFHAHFYPPLLRSATVRKFLVGFEMLAMPQRDFTPEMAAERLRFMSV